MALDFPTSPTNGQQYTLNGVTYYYDATSGSWLTTYVTTLSFANVSENQVVFVNSNQANGSLGLTYDRANNRLSANSANIGILNVSGLTVISNTVTVTGNTTLANVSVTGNLSIARVNTVANNSFGTSGQVLTSNGSGNVYWAPAGLLPPAISNTQTFNASGTWTKPATGTYAIVRCWGGGGGGAGGDSNYGNRSGGGGGGFHEAVFLLSQLTATVSVTVGAGGTGSNPNQLTYGTDGGSTTFGSYLSAGGGSKAQTYNVGGVWADDPGAGGGSGASGAKASDIGGYTPTLANVLNASGNMTVNAVMIFALSNPRNGSSNDGKYGGGTGGRNQSSGGCCPVDTSYSGGNSEFGGGGGGREVAGTGGTSTYGGNGGSVGAGTQPGGGGSGRMNAQGYSGAAGRCTVYVV